MSSTAPTVLQFTLLTKITDGFSKERKVGSGGYGEVFKGKLDNGEEIAVKKLYFLPGLDDEQFKNELCTLARVRHENIVRFVGYCYEIQKELFEHGGRYIFAEREYRILCFEYLQGGSLDKHLYEEHCGLDWHTRYKIIKGICEGLNYLHGLEESILHLDLKPANILLDENMVPKIADFGLSRLFGETRTHITKNCIGTEKYMPPEYKPPECKITKKNDVFSLGVIIIEIMTGREGYSKYHETSSSEQFIELVHNKWKVRIEATSMHTSPEEDCKQVKRCIEIALNCVEAERHRRPTIGDIIHKLRETETMRHNVSMSFSQEMSSTAPRDLEFALLRKITDGFSEERKVGSGRYGEVYKGKLDNGEEIAVKKLYFQPGLDDEHFKNELYDLARVQHQNIVRFVGYCYEIQNELVEHDGRYVFAQREYRILCFEYLQGGSLDMHLSDESNGLDCHTRYKIVKGICEGLNYLHNGSKYPMYHLDLKPANILLDKNMMPKIADFGLSGLFGTTQTHTTKEFIRPFEYMPPEYIAKRQVSNKFDVFSLGVIIIQIMAGPMGYSRSAEMPSKQFIELVNENWEKRLHATSTSKEVDSLEVKKCIEIALRCVEADRAKRPTITEIVDELNKIDTARMSLVDQIRMSG